MYEALLQKASQGFALASWLHSTAYSNTFMKTTALAKCLRSNTQEELRDMATRAENRA